MVLDPVGEVGAAGEERLEEGALRDRARDLGRDDGRLGADHRHLGDAVLLQDRDRLGDRLGGVGVHEVGQLPGLPSQHLADGLVATSPSVGKPYCASHSSLKTLVRYPRPESGSRTTITASSPSGVPASSSATCRAAYAAIPEDPPTSIASSRARRRVKANESASETSITRSATVRS